MNIAVGLSGGIDSSFAAKQLLEQGHQVCGITLRLLSSSMNQAAEEQTLRNAAQAAQSIGIPHRIYDFRSEFKNTVIKYFIDSYRQGETPNPCYLCNKHIKFGLFLDRALKEGFEAVATGHYANVFQDKAGRFLLGQAKDLKKDQSYFLALLNQQQLSRCIFPLSGITKSEIRTIAAEEGFINAKKADSQDICFVPDGDYAALIEKEATAAFPEGAFIDIAGNRIGTHRGLHRYTIGQRRGLALAFGHPVYVIEKNAVNNTIQVGTAEQLSVSTCMVRSLNWISEPPKDTKPLRVMVKTRYRQQFKKARIIPIDKTSACIIFDEPERAVAKGQAAVCYKDGIVLAGGIISDVKK